MTQRSFSLPKMLVAALLFAVLLLELLQYHQVLLQSFQRQWQYRQAWSLAHRQLEVFAVTRQHDIELLDGWRRELQFYRVDASCQRLVVKIQMPQQQ
ncbi:potassium:proton antiporter [Serratia symbiotica]|nr:potassium:proton antiporter [Serratia symbiotica]